jgi:hypothetical protein
VQEALFEQSPFRAAIPQPLRTSPIRSIASGSQRGYWRLSGDQLRRASHSLDQRVGGREQRGSERKAEDLGGFQIDDEFEFGRLVNRDVPRLGPIEDLVHVICEASPDLDDICIKVVTDIASETAKKTIGL